MIGSYLCIIILLSWCDVDKMLSIGTMKSQIQAQMEETYVHVRKEECENLFEYLGILI